MAGFGRMALIGEYFGNPIINVLWYRSSVWLPIAGNPFDDMLSALTAVTAHVFPTWMATVPNDYTLLHMEGVGYDDQFNVVTPTPVIASMNAPGTGGASVTSGAVLTANIKFVLGPQHSITGSVHSKRNRGYVAVGPIQEAVIDNYGHISTAFAAGPLNNLAALLDDTIADLGALVSLIPIRIHEGKTIGLIPWRTYSDILGYQLPRLPGVRKSRLPNA